MTYSGYFSRVVAALLGREAGEDLQARGAGAETSLGAAGTSACATSAPSAPNEWDERIATMRREYEALRESAQREVAAAGQEQLERVFKKLAGPLSNLAALKDIASAGGNVQAGDILTLVKGLEKELARLGMARVGTVGEQMEFDSAIHQRLSGGAVRTGAPVSVELPGFRAGDRILLKAMVSAKGE